MANDGGEPTILLSEVWGGGGRGDDERQDHREPKVIRYRVQYI